MNDYWLIINLYEYVYTYYIYTCDINLLWVIIITSTKIQLRKKVLIVALMVIRMLIVIR